MAAAAPPCRLRSDSSAAAVASDSALKAAAAAAAAVKFAEYSLADDRSIIEPYVIAADEEVQDIDELVQELSLVKFLGIESWQPLVTDVDGEILAIADGVREMVARFWRNPERSEAFLQRKLWILQMNREQPYSDPSGGLVCRLTSGVAGLVDVTGKVGEVRIEPESGIRRPSASAFRSPLEPGASALPSSRVTVTAETPSRLDMF